MRAIIVDDSRAIRTIVGKIVREVGFETVEAGNGQEALAQLNTAGNFELALVDWNMPVMNGLEAIPLIRRSAPGARIVVLSIICNASSSPPLSASPCNRTSHTPDRHQRRNCRQIEFQLPNASGRSRHGAPVRLIQNTPSNTRRWLAGGRPPRNEGMIRKGAMIAHSSSVIKPRITANLHAERSASNHIARRRGNAPQKKDQMRIPMGLGRFFIPRLCGNSEKSLANRR